MILIMKVLLIKLNKKLKEESRVYMESGLLVVQVLLGIIFCLFGLKFQKTIIALIGVVVVLVVATFSAGLIQEPGDPAVLVTFFIPFASL